MSDQHRDLPREPDAIYRRSFALVRAAVAPYRLPAAVTPLAHRLVHACGMPDIVPELAWSGDPMAAGAGALRAGAPVLCDARMVTAAIRADRLPGACQVHCLLDLPGVAEFAAARGTTRSAAGLELARPLLAGAILAIGNAPTALFQLLDRWDTWPERPALILAFPVGFVGAAESKEALIAAGLDVAWLTLRGRRGGSAMAAAAINALLLPEP